MFHTFIYRTCAIANQVIARILAMMELSESLLMGS
ncbi:MAG: hypothetical protein HMLIMOIP_002203, partial [Candidatus Nitrosomirales archaeon]